MGLVDLLKEKVEKQLAAYDEQLEAAQAEAKAKKAKAEADVAGAELEELIAMAEQPQCGILLDEAYEMFHPSKGVSGIRYVKDLDNSNVFLLGACTKGLQCPGIRIGWVVASKENVEKLSNFSSFGSSRRAASMAARSSSDATSLGSGVCARAP